MDGSLTNYTYPGTSNQLSALTGATSRSFSYDGAGNPTTIADQTHTYNNANRLTAIQSGAARRRDRVRSPQEQAHLR